MSKVIIGMSGGVDSSVAAALLKEQYGDAMGVTLKLYDTSDSSDGKKLCGSAKDADDARKMAQTLGMEHRIVEYKSLFLEKVIGNFLSEYRAARTPNPCIVCNKFIKFGAMLDYATENGFDYIATGHYVRKEQDSASGRQLLRRPADLSKDQTYMLYTLSQNQLSHALFPLGDMLKPDVRRRAQELGLISADKPDSQDICFVPDGDYAAFIERVSGEKIAAGDYVDREGNVIGRHAGVECYTIGQRKGLGVAFGHPVFVLSKDCAANRVTLGDEKYLFQSRVNITDVNYIPFDRLTAPMKVAAKIRYNQKVQPATVFPTENGAVIEFEQPQRAITPGQSAVFYEDDVLIGGGIIK